MNKKAWVLAVWLGCSLLPVWPAGGGGGSGGGPADNGIAQNLDPDYMAGIAAHDAGNWQEVIARMSKAVERDENNADAWNHLGHAYRQLGEMDKSFKNYEVALRIDPRHRRAHEYVGEAYLQVGNLAKAEEHLKILDKLCWLPCEEYSDLKEKVEQYRRERAQ